MKLTKQEEALFEQFKERQAAEVKIQNLIEKYGYSDHYDVLIAAVDALEKAHDRKEAIAYAELVNASNIRELNYSCFPDTNPPVKSSILKI